MANYLEGSSAAATSDTNGHSRMESEAWHSRFILLVE
jgi:hypothetical protein